MKRQQFEDLLINLWDQFDERMESEGYRTIVHNDTNMGQGTTSFKEDKFAPIIKLNVTNQEKWLPNGSTLSIHVKDRLGNNTIDGNTICIYILKCGVDSDSDDVVDRFNNMLNDCIDTYVQYNSINKLEYKSEMTTISY